MNRKEADSYIERTYEQLKKDAYTITKDINTSTDLLHHCLQQWLQYYDLSKMSFDKDSTFIAYFRKTMYVQHTSDKSIFNKQYRSVIFYPESNEDIIYKLDNIIDDYDKVKEEKEELEEKFDLLNKENIYSIIDGLACKHHKKYFLKYLYTQVVLYNRTIADIARELDIPKTSPYCDYNYLISEIKRYHGISTK